jgi:hypothetical protein
MYFRFHATTWYAYTHSQTPETIQSSVTYQCCAHIAKPLRLYSQVLLISVVMYTHSQTPETIQSNPWYYTAKPLRLYSQVLLISDVVSSLFLCLLFICLFLFLIILCKLYFIFWSCMISYNVISYSSKSLVKVKVFFASLTEDIVEEELAYTVSKT